MRCSFKRSIHAPPQSVWRLLTDLAGLPERFPQFEGWTIASDPRGADLVTLSHERLNRPGGIEYAARLSVVEPGRVIEVEYLEKDLTQMGQVVRYALEPTQYGTSLVTVLDVKGIVGFVYMFFVIRAFLDQVKDVAEAE